MIIQDSAIRSLKELLEEASSFEDAALLVMLGHDPEKTLLSKFLRNFDSYFCGYCAENFDVISIGRPIIYQQENNIEQRHPDIILLSKDGDTIVCIEIKKTKKDQEISKKLNTCLRQATASESIIRKFGFKGKIIKKGIVFDTKNNRIAVATDARVNFFISNPKDIGLTNYMLKKSSHAHFSEVGC
jgi:hypothetical protein